MRLRSHRDFCAGLMFCVIGSVSTVWAQDYRLGSTALMGPGYFPTMLGILMTVLGLVLGVRAFSPSVSEDRIERVVWQPLVFVLGSVALFAAALPSFGFVVAMFLLIVVSSFAGHDWKIRDTLISYFVLLVFSYLVFIRGLAVQFPSWPSFLEN